MRATIAITALSALILAGCTLDVEPAPEPSPTESAKEASEVEQVAEAPNTVGMALDAARDALDGYEITEIDASGDNRTVWESGNWFVVAQVNDGISVTLEIENERDAAEAERAAEREQAAAEEAAILEISNGISSQDALWACSDEADEVFPYGVRYRHIIGVIGTHFDEDAEQWFAKVEATVTNAFDVDIDYTTECFVDTSTGEPLVVDFIFY